MVNGYKCGGSEYTIAEDDQQQVYRLLTDLLDIALFPALLLAQAYHQRWEVENTLDELKTHLKERKTPIRFVAAPLSRSGNLWLVIGTLGRALFHVPSCTAG